jgi:hypothetical protein
MWRVLDVPDLQQPAGSQSGMDPAEGRDDLGLPGADHGPPSENPEGPIGTVQPTRDVGYEPETPETERRDELADRVNVGMPSPAGRDSSDVLPDVEVPDEQI